MLAILEAGRAGALHGILEVVSDDAGNPHNVMVFWMTGLLSAFLDNAPTYLVFFNLAGGDAAIVLQQTAPWKGAIAAGVRTLYRGDAVATCRAAFTEGCRRFLH